jgi:hypothetical protein
MKNHHIVLALLLLLPLGGGLLAQATGKLTYEFTRKIDQSKMKVISITMDNAGNQVTGGGAPMMDLPDVVTGEETLWFAGGKGLIEKQSPVFRMSFRSMGGGGREMLHEEAGEEKAPPFIETVHIDWQAQAFRDLIRSGKPGEEGAFYKERAFQMPADWKVSKKTKKILGYTCYKATCTYKGEDYEVWFTEEVPLHYSPVNGLFPTSGLVLAISSEVEAWTAKSLELDAPIAPADLALPAEAIPLANEEAYNRLRDKFIEQALGGMRFQFGN